jgi:5-methyltetrahydrofolate--homocysteine methyltransferase
MTGMNVVGDLFGKKCFASSSEISKVMKKQWLIYPIYRSFEGAGDKRGNGKILMATVKEMSMILGKYCSCRFSL